MKFETMLLLLVTAILLSIGNNVLYATGKYDINWDEDDEVVISDFLSAAVRGRISSITEHEMICTPFLKGNYNYYNSDDLDVTVTLDKVRIYNIVGFEYKTAFSRSNEQIQSLLDVAGFTLVAHYKLNGKYYGQEDTYYEATVVKYFYTVHVEFNQGFIIEDGHLKITSFNAVVYSAQVADTIWFIDPDNGFNNFVNGFEEGFPNDDGINELNSIVSSHFMDEHISVNLNEIFAHLVKGKHHGDAC